MKPGISSEGGLGQTAVPSRLRQILHAGGQPRRVVVGVVLALLAFSVLAVAAVGFLMEARRSEQAAREVQSAMEAAQHLVPGAPAESFAIAARKKDINVYLSSLGTVASSNSVVFSISEDYVQEVVRRLDSGQPIAVEAYDRSNKSKFGHGFLVGVDSQIDTATGMLKCKAGLVPEGSNLMVPGFFLNIRMLLQTRHGVVLVANEAIQHDPNGAFVWVVKADQTVTRRTVQVGAVEEKEPGSHLPVQGGEPVFSQWAEVQAGLEPGTLVLIGDLKNMAEGSKVSYKLVSRSEEVEAER
jgi:multidrug efflux pump subunit AcrA (membrane-fusion protein)